MPLNTYYSMEISHNTQQMLDTWFLQHIEDQLLKRYYHQFVSQAWFQVCVTIAHHYPVYTNDSL